MDSDTGLRRRVSASEQVGGPHELSIDAPARYEMLYRPSRNHEALGAECQRWFCLDPPARKIGLSDWNSRIENRRNQVVRPLEATYGLPRFQVKPKVPVENDVVLEKKEQFAITLPRCFKCPSDEVHMSMEGHLPLRVFKAHNWRLCPVALRETLQRGASYIIACWARDHERTPYR